MASDEKIAYPFFTAKRHTMRPKTCFAGCLIFFLALTPWQTYSQQLSSAVKQFVSVIADTVALTHATVIDGTGGPIKTDQGILIIKGRIAKTGNSKNVSIPSSA